MADWIVPALAAAVSGVFALFVGRQWLARWRPHQAAWAAGFAAYAVASSLEAMTVDSGWTSGAYAAYFVLGGATVGLLGLGTVMLLKPARWADLFAVAVVCAIALAAFGVVVVPPDEAALAKGVAAGAKPVPFTNPARWAFLFLNIAGGAALVGGALASWWRTRSHGVLLIGLGALLPALGGALASAQIYDDRIMMQFLGVCLMFAGYLRSRETT